MGSNPTPSATISLTTISPAGAMFDVNMDERSLGTRLSREKLQKVPLNQPFTAEGRPVSDPMGSNSGTISRS